MDMVFKVLIYALRGLAILFLLLDIFQVGSFMWLAMVMVGLYLFIQSIPEFKNGKKATAIFGIIVGFFILIYYPVCQFTA